MKIFGARQIDSLGRIVLPLELRKTLNIGEESYLLVGTDEFGNVIIQKPNEYCAVCDSSETLASTGNKALQEGLMDND